MPHHRGDRRTEHHPGFAALRALRRKRRQTALLAAHDVTCDFAVDSRSRMSSASSSAILPREAS